MFLLSILKETPNPDTMPVIKTTCYPWTDGSFRPLAYARCAYVEQRGFMFDLMSFVRDPVCGVDILDGNCLAVSFCFFPELSGDVITAVVDSGGRCQLYKNGKPSALSVNPEMYGGADEQGWYWGSRFYLAEQNLSEITPVSDIVDGHIMKGNIFVFKRIGGDSHMGAIAPMSDVFIFSSANLADFKTVLY